VVFDEKQGVAMQVRESRGLKRGAGGWLSGLCAGTLSCAAWASTPPYATDLPSPSALPQAAPLPASGPAASPSPARPMPSSGDPFDSFDTAPPPLSKPLINSAPDAVEQAKTAEGVAELQKPETQWRRQRQVYRYAEGTPRPLGSLEVGRPVGVSRNGTVTLPNTEYDETWTVGTGGVGIPPVPEASPGQCFALVRKGGEYRNVQQDYALRPESDQLNVRPALVQSGLQTVSTAPSYERLEIQPATSRVVTEVVEVAPPQTRYVARAPQYRTENRRVEVEPPRTVWRPGRGPVERISPLDGQYETLVELPPVYQTVTRQVQVEAGPLRSITIPGQYQTVTRRVLDRPEQVRSVIVPEQDSAVAVSRVVEPAEVTRIPVPAQYASFTTSQLVSPASLEWRSVLCDADMTPGTINRVQELLNQAGYDAGPVDGRMGEQTLNALNAFQRANALPEDRYINIQTAQVLGLYQ